MSKSAPSTPPHHKKGIKPLQESDFFDLASPRHVSFSEIVSVRYINKPLYDAEIFPWERLEFDKEDTSTDIDSSRSEESSSEREELDALFLPFASESDEEDSSDDERKESDSESYEEGSEGEEGEECEEGDEYSESEAESEEYQESERYKPESSAPLVSIFPTEQSLWGKRKYDSDSEPDSKRSREGRESDEPNHHKPELSAPLAPIFPTEQSLWGKRKHGSDSEPDSKRSRENQGHEDSSESRSPDLGFIKILQENALRQKVSQGGGAFSKKISQIKGESDSIVLPASLNTEISQSPLVLIQDLSESDDLLYERELSFEEMVAQRGSGVVPSGEWDEDKFCDEFNGISVGDQPHLDIVPGGEVIHFAHNCN